MDLFLWNILKFTKELKKIGEHLIKKRTFHYKKSLVHMFLKNIFNI
jgi:hypothetical protein